MPSLKDANENLITDPVVHADLFNQHFCNIHKTVTGSKIGKRRQIQRDLFRGVHVL